MDLRLNVDMSWFGKMLRGGNAGSDGGRNWANGRSYGSGQQNTNPYGWERSKLNEQFYQTNASPEEVLGSEYGRTLENAYSRAVARRDSYGTNNIRVTRVPGFLGFGTKGYYLDGLGMRVTLNAAAKNDLAHVAAEFRILEDVGHPQALNHAIAKIEDVVEKHAQNRRSADLFIGKLHAAAPAVVPVVVTNGTATTEPAPETPETAPAAPQVKIPEQQIFKDKTGKNKDNFIKFTQKQDSDQIIILAGSGQTDGTSPTGEYVVGPEHKAELVGIIQSYNAAVEAKDPKAYQKLQNTLIEFCKNKPEEAAKEVSKVIGDQSTQGSVGVFPPQASVTPQTEEREQQPERENNAPEPQAVRPNIVHRTRESGRNFVRGIHSGEVSKDAPPLERVSNTLRNPGRALRNLFKGRDHDDQDQREYTSNDRGRRQERLPDGEDRTPDLPEHVKDSARNVKLNARYGENPEGAQRPHVASNHGGRGETPRYHN